MMEIIRKLFCKHEWKDVSGEIKLIDEYNDIVGFQHTYICKKCLKKKIIRY